MKNVPKLLLILALLLSCSTKPQVCIYGGSSASVMAAYSAACSGSRVVIVCPDVTLGGMTTGGLGQTDIGNKQAVTGLSRKFYRQLGQHYGKLEQWIFEPHVAEEILLSYLDHPGIKVIQGYHLDSVTTSGTRIISITCKNQSGNTITETADQFIDCSYEGDLLAAAGVSYIVGREDNSLYNEKWNGFHLLHEHQFPDGIDPYVEKGNPASGLLWGICDSKVRPDGSGDSCVQAYNFRICLTDSLENLIPIERPADYDSVKYELLVRLFEAGYNNPRQLLKWDMMPNRKTDINNQGPFSTDMIGMNYDYPEASWQRRQQIIQAHKSYTLGLLYFLGHDSRVPATVKDFVIRWGLPKDEYPRTGHWSHQLYIREARRMIGEYVATQADCENRTLIEDGIAYAAYTMDSHNSERLILNNMVKNAGDVQKPGGHPYPISYRSITPKRDECTNLLVPVCLSASHIAYGSIRMEPVFMETGQAAGLAASMAGKGNIQDIDVKHLQTILQTNPYLDGSAPDILIDEDSECIHNSENWERIAGYGSYGNSHLVYKGNPSDNHLEYAIPDSLSGTYDLYTYQTRSGCDTTLFIVTTNTQDTVLFSRKDFKIEGQTSGEWFKIGTYTFTPGHPKSLRITSPSPNLHADALLLLPSSPH